MKTSNSPAPFLVAVEEYRKALAAFAAAEAIDENGDDINELDDARFHAKCMVEISQPASLGEFFQKLEFIAIESEGDIINAKIIDLVAADLCLLTGYRHIQSEAIKAQWRNGAWGPEPPTPAPYDGDLSAVIDPDTELKRRWADFMTLDRTPFSSVTEKADEQTEAWGKARKDVASLPAHTVAGLSIKLQLALVELVALDEPITCKDEIITTALEAAERLAPGSVIYRPVDDDQDAEDEADDSEGRNAA